MVIIPLRYIRIESRLHFRGLEISRRVLLVSWGIGGLEGSREVAGGQTNAVSTSTDGAPK